jgi:hypothetical protein
MTPDVIRLAETLSHNTTLGPVDDYRRLGPDGWFWPLPRQRMVHATPIRQRMAQDLRAYGLDAGEFEDVHQSCLTDLGWTELQVRAHGAAAVALMMQRRVDKARELGNEVA